MLHAFVVVVWIDSFSIASLFSGLEVDLEKDLF